MTDLTLSFAFQFISAVVDIIRPTRPATDKELKEYIELMKKKGFHFKEYP